MCHGCALSSSRLSNRPFPLEGFGLPDGLVRLGESIYSSSGEVGVGHHCWLKNNVVDIDFKVMFPGLMWHIVIRDDSENSGEGVGGLKLVSGCCSNSTQTRDDNRIPHP